MTRSAASPLPEGSAAQTIDCGGLRLHVVTAGPVAGEPVLLLHGFPEFWYGWRQQIPALAGAGYRVIVPDQRGYNLSDKPAGLDGYTLDALAGDMLRLLDALAVEHVHVAGHDFGAAVAWELAEMHAPRLKSLTVLNVPHTRVFERALKRGNLAQMRKSRYQIGFQLRGVAERRLANNDYARLVDGFLGRSVPGTFTEDDLAHYRAAWSQPGALTGMLNWYRAAGLGARKRRDRPQPRIRVPVQILWGEQDAFVEQSLAEASAALCDDVDLVFYPQAGHFVQHEEAAAITTRLRDFVAAHTT